MTEQLDFQADNHGSIIMLTPETDAARDWCADNLPDDAQMFGNAFAIEPRYFGDIAAGLLADGLTGNFEVEAR